MKILGTQMGYPIGVLIWVVVKIDNQNGFWFILLSEDVNLVYQNNPRATLVFYNRIGDFLILY